MTKNPRYLIGLFGQKPNLVDLKVYGYASESISSSNLIAPRAYADLIIKRCGQLYDLINKGERKYGHSKIFEGLYKFYGYSNS